MKTNMISVTSVRIRSVFIPNHPAPACLPSRARCHKTTRENHRFTVTAGPAGMKKEIDAFVGIDFAASPVHSSSY